MLALPLKATLLDPAPESDSLFGHALASGDLDGDGRADIVVGAFNSDVGAQQGAGEVFVFLGRNPLQSSYALTVRDPLPENNARFGYSVATGDVNGDGKDDLLVGAPDSYSAGVPAVGQAFVFLGGDPFNTVADFTITDPTPHAFGSFAWAVASGDVNGDGLDEAIVSGIDSFYVTTPGEVLVYLGGQPFDATADVALDTSELGNGAQFGRSIVAADFTGDGYDDLAVGGAGGGASVFLGGASIDPTSDYHPSGPSGPDLVMDSLAAGDVNLDGKDDLVLGPSVEDVGPYLQAGRAYVFLGSSPLDETADSVLQEPTPETGAIFGQHVAVGDVSRDGYADVIVGAEMADVESVEDAGEVFIFFGDSAFDDSADLALTDPTPEYNARFGRSLVAAGFPSDVTSALVVGAPEADVGGMINAGEVHVFLMEPVGGLSELTGTPDPNVVGGRQLVAAIGAVVVAVTAAFLARRPLRG